MIKKAVRWYDFTEQILIENNVLKNIKLVKSNIYRTFTSARKIRFYKLEIVLNIYNGKDN